MGFFPQLIGGDRPAGNAAGPEVVRRDQFRQGAQAAVDIITSFGKGNCRRAPRQERRRIAAPGAKQSRRPKKPMSPAVSLLSSAMSGHRTLPATTFIAISFGATTEQRLVSSNLSPRCRRSQSKSSRSLEMDGDG
jgi:hypothetical protein